MPLRRRTNYGYGRSRRPVGVWIALVVGVLGVLAALLGVLVPITGLVGAAAGIVAGAHVSVVGISVVVVLGYLVAGGLLLAIVRTRHRLAAWTLAILAILLALAAALYPLVAVGFGAANGVGDLVGTIVDIVHRVWG